MKSDQRLTIKRNIDILLYHKYTIITCLLLGTAAGLFYYLQLPKTYQGTALIQYQRQSVNPTLMSPDDNRTQARDIVNTVSQQITSRSSLEGIINQFNLYTGMREAVPMENIVETMRNDHIQTQFLEGGDVFEVSYLGHDQQKVMDVANTLAQKFIEENLRFRLAQASQTSTYIQDELSMAKEALDKKELIMRDYKLRYYNEMSDQLLNHTNRLNGLQQQYQNNQTSRLELERTRLLVQEQIAARREILSPHGAMAVDSSPLRAEHGPIETVEQIRLKLQNLQPRYTDNHPEIKRLKKILANLGTKQKDLPEKVIVSQDPQLTDLRQQVQDIEFTINSLNEERLQLNQQISKYEGWIAAAPIREAEWSALTRDYQQLNEHYQRLVTQGLQATSAQSLEKQLQGSQFKIVDYAHFPEKPLKPLFSIILLVSSSLGLGLGIGAAYGLELLGTSFKDPVDLEKYLDVPVICALPSIHTKNEIFKRKTLRVINLSILVSSGALILAAFMYFWKQGMIIL